MVRRILLLVLILSVLAVGPAPAVATAAEPPFDFSTWHFPLPAGEWLISRGPCGGNGLYDHACGYFEDRCAFDLTPISGSMDSVPVLAPQAGQVFFAGTRNDSGLSVMLRHADGRISALLHLSRIVVASDQRVTQGQVVGYAGSTGSSTGPHLHFDVQPNAVERSCLPLDTIDEMDHRTMTVVSHNLPWSSLTLVDPPDTLPAWLALVSVGANQPTVVTPGGLVLAPGTSVALPVAIRTSMLPASGLRFSGRVITPTQTAGAYTLFRLPIVAPAALGSYSRVVSLVAAAGPIAPLRFSVRPAPDTSTSTGLILISPTFVSPANYVGLSKPPKLCWSEPASAGLAPLTFRVMVVGSTPADSDWISDTCWQAPPLAAGYYSWKVFVRDGQGYMNRPNQRPWVFKILAP